MTTRRAAKKRQSTSSPAPATQLSEAGIGAFFRPSQMVDAELTRDQLRSLIRQGAVERVGRGLYRLTEAEPTEQYSLAMACARVPNGIVCLPSALRVHGIGTQAPAEVWLAIPHKARRPRLHGLLTPRGAFQRRRGEVRSHGNHLRRGSAITSPARTVADCFRYERLVGAEVALEALNDALRRRLITVAECHARGGSSPVAATARGSGPEIDLSPDIPASVKARLLKGAHQRGEEFERTLSRYAAERFLYGRPVGCPTAMRLKGAGLSRCGLPTRTAAQGMWICWPPGLRTILQSAASSRRYARCLARRMVSDSDLTALTIHVIRPEGEYSGKRARFVAWLGRARIALQVDFGFGGCSDGRTRGDRVPHLA